tara:strand:- start:1213 stop:1626 length:414 start_codon:yes stop_codon:yes gene_type:complete
MLNLQEVRVLESLINTTFGRSSMRDAGHAIAFKTMNHCDDGMILEIRFETLININSHEGVQTAQKNYDDVSRKAIDEQIKQIKADFRAEAGRTLKAKEFKSERSGQQPLKESFLEIISFNPSLLRGKYYRTIQYHLV